MFFEDVAKGFRRRMRQGASGTSGARRAADLAARAAAKPKTTPAEDEPADELAELIGDLGGRVGLSMLNQDRVCRAKLKPLLKEAGMRTVTRAWLEKYDGIFVVDSTKRSEVEVVLRTPPA